MKNRRIIKVGLMILAAMMMTGLNAQSFRNNRMTHQNRVADRFSLDLSAEQKEELKSLRGEHYKTIKPLRNKMAELKAKENTLMSESKVDLKAVNKIVDEQTDLLNKIKKLQVEQRLSAKEILTEEQIMKLEQRKRISKSGRGHGNDIHRSRQKDRSYRRNMG